MGLYYYQIRILILFPDFLSDRSAFFDVLWRATMVRRLGGLHQAGSTSNSFIAALKLRDEPAWNRYLEIYQRLILRRYLQAGLSFDLSEELAHNVTAEVHNRIGNFVPGNFRGWLWAIARNIWANHIRDSARPHRASGGSEMTPQLEQVSLRLEQLSTDEELMRKEDVAIAKDVFLTVCAGMNLPMMDQQLILDVITGALSPREAAASCTDLETGMIGISVGSFYKRKSRILEAVQNVRKMLYEL